MNSEASNANKENEIAKDQTYLRECLSPQTQQCVDLLMGMKNSVPRIGKNPKSSLPALSENVDDKQDAWPPVITSPLKLVVPLTNSTSFTFGDAQSGSHLCSSSAEVLSAANTNSLYSHSSLSSSSSIKRGDSSDAFNPPSKLSRSDLSEPTSFSFLLSAASSHDALENALPREKPTKSARTTPPSIPGLVTCNCKKSRCLKLYCECFKSQEYCSSECNCLNCYNNRKHESEREEAVQRMKARNPHCFENHVDEKKGVSKSGCRCRRTHCDKKYCECFSHGVPCGDQCQCKDCKNEYGCYKF